jgi:hypothetical protein
LILLALLLIQVAAAPGADQPPSQHLHEVVVEAIRNCPQPKADEIAVCARDRGYSQRYRMERLKPYHAEQSPPVKVDVTAGAGASGVGSCSTAGAGGQTGCQLKADNDWRRWKEDEKADGRQFPW